MLKTMLNPLKFFSLLLVPLLLPLEVRAENLLRVSVPGQIDSFDSSKSNSSAFRTIVHGNVYETLVNLNHLGEPIPSLATAWKVNYDQTRITFTLRPGVVFHDGSAFNCEAVQRLIVRRPEGEDRYSRPHTMPVLGRVKRATCSSKEKINIELSEPYVFAIEDFASYRMGLFRVRDDGFNKVYLGTGPFIFAKSTKRGITLKRNSNYWGVQPEIDEVQIDYESDDALAIEAVLEGARDLAVDLQDTEAIKSLFKNQQFLQHRDNLHLRHGLLEEKIVLEMNHDHSLLGRSDFRCGVTYALDREILNEQIFYGKARPLYSLQSVYHPRYQSQLEGLGGKDASSAQILLSEFPANERTAQLRLLIIDTPQNQAIARNLVRMMRRVELNVVINAVDFEEYRTKFYIQRDYDLVLVRHDNANDIAHYYAGHHVYGFSEDTFRDHLQLALQGQGGEVVARARLNSMLQYQYHTCQQAFLLQRPEFYLSRGSWRFPNLNRPSLGFDFSAIAP